MALMLAATLGMGAASAYASHQAAKGRANAQSQSNATNSKLIDQELSQSYSDNMLQAMQQMMSLRTALEDQQRDAMKARGTAITAAGEAGASGQSFDLALGDLEGSSARYKDRLRQQNDWQMGSIRRQRRSLYNSALRSKAGLPTVNKPSSTASALSAGASLAGTYMNYK